MGNRFYDLHIHSCLSPCASDDMTPSNIAGMAYIKGLSLIALTDHNSGRNLIPTAMAASEYGLVFIPGIEVTTVEEIHVLTYFSELEAAVDFGDMLYKSLPEIKNRPDIFGRQIVVGTDDKASGELDKLLLQATPYTIDNITDLVHDAGGCAVPAHINRESFSVFANIGFLPEGLFKCVEVAGSLPCPPLDTSLFQLRSSDAHTLGDIAEPVEFLRDIDSAADFIHFIKNIGIK